MQQVKAEFVASQKGIMKNNDDVRHAIVSDFNSIKSELLHHKRHREEFYEALINKLVSDTLNLKEVIVREKRERQETHGEVVNAIKAMRSKFVSLNEVAWIDPARNKTAQAGPA